jgi:hypothetical protein
MAVMNNWWMWTGLETTNAQVPSMCLSGTPLEPYLELGMIVKREDMCCPTGPHFSKTRGVWAHIAKRPETLIGCLDTSHSQGGWATAQACSMLGKRSIIFYPAFKQPRPLSPSQENGQVLGAELVPLAAGRSAVLYHQAKREVEERGGYMMPNALKLDETVEETAREFIHTCNRYTLWGIDAVLVSASSGTIAAGIFRGMRDLARRGLSEWDRLPLLVHLGYDRPDAIVKHYIGVKADRLDHQGQIQIINEHYAYKDKARPGPDAPFPCNPYYDLKAFRYHQQVRGTSLYKHVLFWNVG